MIDVSKFNNISKIRKSFKPGYLKEYGFRRKSDLNLINTKSYTLSLSDDDEVKYVGNKTWEVK